VDSADERRLADCKHELSKLLHEEKLAGAPLLILANKQDVGSALPKQQIIEALALQDISKRHWFVLGCSAVTGGEVLRQSVLLM